jgi:hypothetical protein
MIRFRRAGAVLRLRADHRFDSYGRFLAFPYAFQPFQVIVGTTEIRPDTRVNRPEDKSTQRAAAGRPSRVSARLATKAMVRTRTIVGAGAESIQKLA